MAAPADKEVSMRHIVMLILTLFLLSPSMAAADLIQQPVDYKVGDVTLKGFLAYDNTSDQKRPGILVVHEWWGHNEYARQRARQLAQEGYVALAVDMYGDGKKADHPEDAGKFAKAVMAQIETGRARFEAAMALLKSQPQTDPDKIGAIGYCFGGGVVLTMARMGVDFDGAVSFHGSLASPVTAKPGMVKAKILVLNGANDPFVTAEQIAAFKKEMETAQAHYRFVSYPGVKHSFTNPEADAFGKKFNLPLAYDAQADQKSWAAMHQFFDEIFK
jgi:dienelactone hydrolase